jgi:hypothetical protein
MRLFVRDVAGQTLSLQVDGQARFLLHVVLTIQWLVMAGGSWLPTDVGER